MEATQFFNYKDKTLRLDPSDWDFVNEQFEDITGSEDKTTIHKFFMMAVKKAVRLSTPREKIVENPANVQKIIDLDIENAQLIKELEAANNKIKSLEAEPIIKTKQPANNQLLITLSSPLERAIVNHAVFYCNENKPKDARNYTHESLIKQFFISQSLNGPHAF